ncbi:MULTISPECIES: MFS transporter [Devosia]|uniref:Putative MFS-type transporter YcaD n=1 Tax=Devosia equisanguinis TaxID=2490941 RepID=A0A3S4CCH9_9HYPH|nr:MULTISPECIES: MFS transporter [Devosia]ODT47519.1 MAG: MFS transporter [Pelagibacterium sp. SCN 63-126]ODU86150.1 MAG: MFS transporter [Pelagibacterium sp. SCN 63-17]OJX42774.1 MAG: MFS transporter [Devosia sp. 63-57]VDS04050.1 putative MFS-type transporter YcaD [Devosia equisanguinis]
MASVIKIYALFLGSALLMFGGGLQGLLLSVRGAEEGFSLLSLGLIGTGWSVGFVAGSLFVPLIVRKVGHIRAFSVMAAIGTVTILLNLLLVNDVSWILLRALSGFCFAGAAMIVESWLNEVADNKNRGTVFSIYVTINMAASTMGQLAMSVTGTAGYIPFVVGAISFICAVLPTALTSSPQPRPLQSAKLDLKLLYKTSPVAAIAAFSCGMANGAFGTLAPVYGYEQGLDASGIALLFAIAAILGAVAQVPFGRLSDRIDRRLVLIGLSSFAALVGALTAIINPDAGWAMYVLFAAYGFAANPIYAVAVAHANDFAKDGEFAKIAGGMLLILGTGLAIGPAVASMIMGAWSPVGLFVVTATFHGALAGTAYLRMRVRKSPDASSRAPFQPMSDKQATPESFALDPRADSDADDFPVTRETAVPEELIETVEGDDDVQNGKI